MAYCSPVTNPDSSGLACRNASCGDTGVEGGASCTDQARQEEPGCGPFGLTPYELLSAALDDPLSSRLLAPARRPDTEMLAWSAVHVLAMLLTEGPLRHLDRAHATAVCEQLLDHVEVLFPRPNPLGTDLRVWAAGDGNQARTVSLGAARTHEHVLGLRISRPRAARGVPWVSAVMARIWHGGGM